MTTCVRSLGIDLASRSWDDNGTAVVAFSRGPAAAWSEVSTGCIAWPDEALTPASLADAVDGFALAQGARTVCLDGPQGWRHPEAGDRPGVGRACEYQLRTQGKTGAFGRAYPGTQLGWITFCIEVFDRLLERPHVRLANDRAAWLTGPPDRGYLLVETFPTASWRDAGLTPLPGKGSMRGQPVTPWTDALRARFGLPPFKGECLSHDDLQGVVCALSGAALLGGPCSPLPYGTEAEVAHGAPRPHRTEGLIWTCRPKNPGPIVEPGPRPKRSARRPGTSRRAVRSGSGPRAGGQSGGSALDRGVALFEHLVAEAEAGRARGVGYAQFACIVRGVARFDEIVGRPYAQSDTAGVVQLAGEVTAAAGGRRPCARGATRIEVAMDTFIWPAGSGHRLAPGHFGSAPYNATQWLRVFPDGERRLLTEREARQAVGGR